MLGGNLFIRMPRKSRRALEPRLPTAAVSSGLNRVYKHIFHIWTPLSPHEWAATAPHHGMFGNSVAGVMPNIALAVEKGFAGIFVSGGSPFTSARLFNASGEHQVDADFFVSIHESLRQAKIRNIRGLVHPTQPIRVSDETAQASWAYLSRAITPKMSITRSSPEVPVIHLRGGDVYFGRRHLPNHGQPPVSYYIAVLRSLCAKKVLVVHQGEIPMLTALTNRCNELGISVATQSASLKEDLEKLLGASILIAGRGSFAPAVAGLSPSIERAYYFESGFGLTVRKPSITLVRARDKSGEYVARVLSYNWARREDQLSLAIDYPEDEIVLDTC